jgi:hypothetical protein
MSNPLEAEAVQRSVAIGDWIQITGYPVVTLLRSGIEDVHGTVRSVAHVLEIDPDGWVTAYFERTRDISSVAPDNFKVIATPDTGR